MKRLSLVILLIAPILAKAQRLKYSRAYLGAVLQDSRPGGSLILSYGVNQYLGIGAGVDILSYKPEGIKNSKFFAPFYGDLRLKYPVKAVEPFIMGQFGKPSYEQDVSGLQDFAGSSIRGIKQRGKYFYGVGAGAMIRHQGHLGVFLSATYRKYYFNYDPDHIQINGNVVNFADLNSREVLLSIGLVF